MEERGRKREDGKDEIIKRDEMDKVICKRWTEYVEGKRRNERGEVEEVKWMSFNEKSEMEDLKGKKWKGRSEREEVKGEEVKVKR